MVLVRDHAFAHDSGPRRQPDRPRRRRPSRPRSSARIGSRPVAPPKSSTQARCQARPCCAAVRCASSTSRVLPMPASPRSSTAWPRPVSARAAINARSWPSSRRRPTSGPRSGSAAASPTTRHACSGAAKPLTASRPASATTSAAAQFRAHAVRDQHLARRRRIGQARGQVHRVAGHRVLTMGRRCRCRWPRPGRPPRRCARRVVPDRGRQLGHGVPDRDARRPRRARHRCHGRPAHRTRP